MRLSSADRVEVHPGVAAHRQSMTAIRFGAPRSFASEARVPGDKSISHRVLLLAACARGTTVVEAINRGDDVMATVAALRALGISVADDGIMLRIDGGEFASAAGVIDCGNSGTTMRFLMGVLAGRTACTLDGDASLRRRPMKRVAAPLLSMGAAIETGPAGSPPVTLRIGGTLRGIDYELPVASAQVKSAILLAGLRASGVTTVRSPMVSRDHTELMLSAMGAAVRHENSVTSIRPGTLHAIERYAVPGDPSAAIFFLIAVARTIGAALSVPGVCVNPTRTAAFEVMRAMGAHLAIGESSLHHGEPVATVAVDGGAPLRAVEIAPSMVPALIDELPALCALASLADGEFAVRGAGELRVKESDRIASTVRLLHAFGAEARETDDGIIVRGGATLHEPSPIETSGDHRIGMAAASLAAAIGTPVEVRDADCIATSFPDFAARWAEAFGMEVESL